MMAARDSRNVSRLDRRAYIVDDDPGMRAMLRRMLTDDGIYTEEFDSAEGFLAEATARPPGCVLVDLRLPGMDGLELLERLREVAPFSPVIMLSGYGDIPAAVRAVKQGAVDFLQKPFRKEQLQALVQEAFDKLRNVSLATLQTIELLTTREREVLAAFADGAANKIVAHRLGVSPRTVEMHRAAIFRKLGVSNLSQALFRARDAGIIQ